VIAGKFRLEREIGRGGMGSVWAARHVLLDMPVALKFIEAENDHGPPLDMPDARARFEREARAAGQVRSPHVVQIIDHGIDEKDRPYIAMELLEGEDLGERLRREGRIPVAAAARILTQASKALRRAHEGGIIHRDLKPGNVFLARFDDDEVVKLLDFGVAKMRRAGVLEQELATQTGIVFGSPSYMSPEQARGARAIDHRSDLWSLAVIVFRAITGVKPFQASSIADLVIKLCIDPLPVATQVSPDLPPAMDAFFMRAFARDPDQRFQTAVDLAAAFEVAASAPASLRPAALHATGPSFSVAAGAPPGGPGSGPHVAFAPGTLTPPPPEKPVAMGETSQPRAAPPAAPRQEPTPGSGVSALPSGGWRIGLPAAALEQPVQPEAAATMLMPTQVMPRSPPAGERAPQQPEPPQRPLRKVPRSTLERVRERSPAILVTSLGGGVIVAIVLAVVARQGPRPATLETRAGAATAVTEVAPPIAEAKPATPPATAVPAVTPSAAPEPEPSANAAAPTAPSAEPSASAESEPAPAPSGSAAPRAPLRWGKKKTPNFGY
jgi:serine/threonine protein kinase